MKTYVLYHENCPDGTGAAMAAYLKLGDVHCAGTGNTRRVEYIPVSYGKPPPEIEPDSDIFIVDFSYPRDTLKELKTKARDILVLDHHITAEKDLEGLDFCQFDMAKSGAVLSWKHFHPQKPVPPFILYLQDRDLWQFKLPQSREVSAAIASYPMDFRVWSNWLNEETIIEDLASEGVTCLRLKNQQVQNMVKHHRRAVLDGKHKAVMFVPPAGENEVNGFGITVEPDQWACPVSNASVFFSEVGEALLEYYPDAPFSAYYFDRADGKRQWGLRSRKGFDCSVIAKAFGGGGHKEASGFVQNL